MSDQKIQEFRERAERMVAPVDPDLLLQRGRALRRRRQLAPVVAVAACAAIGIAVLAPGDADTRTEPQPVSPPTQTPTEKATETVSRVLGESEGQLPPGAYELDHMVNEEGPDATVQLVGEGWAGWDGGAHLDSAQGTVSWGIKEYSQVHVDRCSPDGPGLERGLSRSEVVSRVSRVEGTQVTSPARPATMLGLTGTHLQVSVPWIEIDCPTGRATEAVLMASWEGPEDPTVTVDVWVLEDGDRLLMLTKGVRGDPSPAQLEAVDTALDTLRLTR